MRITTLILLIGVCLVSTKDFPYKSSDNRVFLRSKRSNSDEPVQSMIRQDSSDSEKEDDNPRESQSKNKRQEKEEEQHKKLAERQEKAGRKEEKALRKLKEKQAKQQRKEEKKREKEDQKRLERLENEKRQEEERKKKTLEKREKTERKKHKKEQKQTEKLQKETLKEESTHNDSSVNIADVNSVDLGDIWRNFIYFKYGLTLLSTKAEKQAAMNKYMQDELGIASNKTGTERRQAAVKLIQSMFQNNTVARDALKNHLINHINPVNLHKLRTYFDTNIDKIDKKSELLNNVRLPWATVAQKNLKEQRSIFQTISQFLSNILPNWATGGHNKFGSSSDNSNIDIPSENEVEGSTIMYSDVSSPSLPFLDSNIATGNNTESPLSSSTNNESLSGVSSSNGSSNNNGSINLNDNFYNPATPTNDAFVNKGPAVSSGDTNVAFNNNDDVVSVNIPSISTVPITSEISHAAINNNNKVGSANNSNSVSVEGNKAITDESINAPSSTAISVESSNATKNKIDVKQPNTIIAITVRPENMTSSNVDSSFFGGGDDFISDKGNVLSTISSLSMESTAYTESFITVSVDSANNETNTETIITENNGTASNNNASIESGNALVPGANLPSTGGSNNNNFFGSTTPSINTDPSENSSVILSTNAKENSSSTSTVAAVSDESSNLVTVSDTVTVSSVTNNAFSTGGMTIDVAQISETDSVSTESNPVVSESDITHVTVNTEDENVTPGIDKNKSIEPTLGVITTESPVLETVSNDALSVEENITLSTEATAIDTTSAHNTIEQVTVTRFDTSTQLISQTAVTNSEVPTTINEDISNANLASNNAVTEPSFNGWLKQPGQNPQFVNTDDSVNQRAPIQNPDGMAIPGDGRRPNFLIRQSTPPPYFRLPKFHLPTFNLLPSSRPLWQRTGIPQVLG